MTRPVRSFAASLVVVVALIGAGCSGDDSGAADTTGGNATTTTTPDGGTTPGDSSPTTVAAGNQPLRIEAMPAAVAAVEAALGGEQRYFEVNATPTLVNLFVAGADGTTATAYVYDAVNDALGEPSEPQQASGNTFTWGQADFDPTKVLVDALGQLPNALPRTFAVTAAGENAVQYLVTLESTQGGVLDVLVTKDGTVLGAQAR